MSIPISQFIPPPNKCHTLNVNSLHYVNYTLIKLFLKVPQVILRPCELLEYCYRTFEASKKP